MYINACNLHKPVDWQQDFCVTGEDTEVQRDTKQLAEDHMTGRDRSQDLNADSLVED